MMTETTYKSEDGFGLKNKMDVLKAKIASVEMALKKADEKNRIHLEKRLDEYKKELEKLDTAFFARIQLTVYEKRLGCDKWKENHNIYRSHCAKLRKMAKI